MGNTVLQGYRLAEVSCVPGAGEPSWPEEDQASMYLRCSLLGVSPSSGALSRSSLCFLMSFYNSLPVIIVAQKLTLMPSIPLGLTVLLPT